MVLGIATLALCQRLSGRQPGTQQGLWDSWPPGSLCHGDEHPEGRKGCWEHQEGRRGGASEWKGDHSSESKEIRRCGIQQKEKEGSRSLVQGVSILVFLKDFLLI